MHAVSCWKKSLSTPLSFFEKFRQTLFGAPLNPLAPQTRQHIVLIAFLAWVGLGADGLSSSAYGPEQSFIALGGHTQLGLYLALATALTVFVIAAAYTQVIELFPSGGGGYKLASQLIGPYAGLTSGAALIVDYVLTITISVASGVDALFSLLPVATQGYKIAVEVAAIIVLIALNLRGMKESIKVLLPLFLGFIFTHTLLIVYGIQAHMERLPMLLPDTLKETAHLSQDLGWVFVAALFLRAYSLGGGTYTGIEAVSNNVNTLAEPRVRTGKFTMLYMALSLAFTAGGIIVLYLLWDARPAQGQTLNAVVFASIMQGWHWGDVPLDHSVLVVVMAFEAGLLAVAANTGFLGGPAVLANMATDSWVPRQFRHLSSRLVTQNGILLMGSGALAILWLSHGDVGWLVVLYSINVFITFSLSLYGLCVHWWQSRLDVKNWKARIALALLGFIVTTGILLVTLVEKFGEGGWITLAVTAGVVAACAHIKSHYNQVDEQLRVVDKLFATGPTNPDTRALPLDPEQPTAVFLVGRSRGAVIHTLLWVQRLFPGHFKNFIFLCAGEIDSQSYHGKTALTTLQYAVDADLMHDVEFCTSQGLAAKSYRSFGTEPLEELTKLAEQIVLEHPNTIFFTSKLIFEHENWLTRLLHNQTALAMQRRLHLRGMQMIILPLKIERTNA